MMHAIDISQLEMMTSGDAALAVEALGIFRQSAELWSRLLDPLADAEQWADAAHGIKGAARSIGAMALGDACESAEKLGRSGMASRVEAAVAISAV
jgi:HPt (histidine-containing phosphotransfer) domain-containing protein